MFITAIFLLAIIFFLYLDCRKPKGYPPGPRWWPVLGCALEIARIHRKTKYIYRTCLKLRDKYGPIVGLKIGVNRIVVLNDIQSMRAMFLNKDCDGRPTGIFYSARTSGVRRGLLLSDEQPWVEQRRFVVRHLRQFGISRTGIATLVEDEARKLLEHLKKLLQDIGKSSKKNDLDMSKLHNKFNVVEDEILKHKLQTAADFCIKAEEYGKVKRVSEAKEMIIEMVDIFNGSVLSTVWRIIFGKRLEISDKKFERLQQIITKILAGLNTFSSLFNDFPILRFIIPETSGYKSFIKEHKEFWDFIEEELQYYKKTLDPNAPRGLVDVYLTALSSNNFSDSFNELQLIAICMDLFIAGTETTSNTLAFGFLYLILFPRVQKKAQEEIDRVIGRDRLPTLADKSKMPYIQAVIMESLRMFAYRTNNLPRRALKDITIMGHKIPKDTILIASYSAEIVDNQVCDDFENFRPERFFDSDGNIVTPSNYFFFGLGNRHCIGEMLARSSMFIIISTVLQTFNFSVVPGEPQPSTDFIDGVTASPKPFRALVSLRA